ncbi:MAG TPA: pyridoxal-phosphate dependent enzyme [Candidatus Dormibacteraeota bacterium]|nr:pyridoxal-phosphate dependent enzyme [Candidatus Dormibacteraeota bacterium]
MDATISVEGIRAAADVVDPVFLHSPQFDCEPLSERLGVATVLKVESVNPIRSFKGRGTDYLLHKLGGRETHVVCASAGNFGQGMAYACRKRGVPITVFAARGASPLKIDRMRALGATVGLEGDDFDEAKDAARAYATRHGFLFVEDGLIGAIGEGAGTIGLELAEGREELDAIFVPLGNGSLVNGVGTWIKHASSQTRIIAVCAEGAPSMALSWKARKALDAPTDSIADGIAVRVPVPAAVEITLTTVDDVMLVSDDAMRMWIRRLFTDAGLVVEPSGAAGLAAIAEHANDLEGKRVATILTGGNLTEQQIKDWLY